MNKKTRPSKKSHPALLWALGGLVLLIGIAAAFLLTNQDPAQTTGMPKEITVAEAHQKWEGGTFLLDVREPSEWQEGHIPNTTLIPLGQLETRLAELPKDQEIVVVCRSGNRSATGRDILLEAGFESVTSMAGGVNSWKSAGYPVETGQ